MITVQKTPVERRTGEFAPMASEEVQERLRKVHHAAMPLYLANQSLPDGFAPSDEFLRLRLGWTCTMLRKAKEGLAKAGLYVWENIQVAAGKWIKVCRYLTNPVDSPSSQVQPSDPLPTVGQRARIPRTTERTERGERPSLKVDHDPNQCVREAAGQPCRQCAKLRVQAVDAAAADIACPPVHFGPERRPAADVIHAEGLDTAPRGPIPDALKAQVGAFFEAKAKAKLAARRQRSF